MPGFAGMADQVIDRELLCLPRCAGDLDLN